MISVKRKLKHLIKHFNFKREELTEIEKMYNLDYFNPNDEAYQRLLKISKELCEKYSKSYFKLGKNPSIFKIIKIYFERKKILSLLFIKHKILASVGENIDCVIGLVDINGSTFINREVIFSKYCLVSCDKFSIFGPKIKVGNADVKRKDNLIKLGKISFNHDCWICSGVEIANDVSIGAKCVLAAGAKVLKSTNDEMLLLGRPAYEYKKITKNMESKKPILYTHTKEELEIILNHLRHLGFKNLKEYKKVLSGKKFNGCSLSLARIYLYSHRLSSEYNNPDTPLERKKEILDILFPIKGDNLTVGKNLFVDLIGTTIIRNNVVIKDNTFFAGNVILNDNTIINDGASLFASGHELYYKGRRTGFSFKHGFYEFSISEPIIVNSVSIGKDSIIVSGTMVEKSTNNNALVTGNKIIEY